MKKLRYYFPKNSMKKSHYSSKLKTTFSWVLFLLCLPKVFAFEGNANKITNSFSSDTEFNTVIQDNEIKGTVIDSNGIPLPGASVLIKNTTNGTTTDFDGNYKIVAKKSDILVFSYIGYLSKEVTVGNENTINVTLEANSQSLDEIVIVGYGTKRRADLTGSVSSLDDDVFVDQATTSIEQGIQGRLAGVQVIQSSGQPGAGMSIKVRGTSSFSGGTDPLYVIDGFPIVNSDTNNNTNALSTINPNDIASIEVLKDAAATAIYGSRAANGVVLITTKSGKSGAPKITYNTYAGVQTLRNKVEMMSGSEFEQYVTNYYNNSNSVFTPSEIAAVTGDLNQFGGANIDWHDEIYRQAIQQSHDLTVSGGTEKTKYFMSASYLSQDGIAKNTDFNRYSMRMNLSSKISDKVDVTGRINVSRSTQNGFVAYDGTNSRTGGKNGVGSVLNAYPNVEPFNENGGFANIAPFGFSGSEIENPYAFLDVTDRNTTSRVLSGIDLSIKLMDGLTNKTRTGIDYINRRTDTYFPSTLPNLGAQTIGLNTREQLSVLVENYFEFNKDLTDNIKLSATAGVSLQEDKIWLTGISAAGLPTDDLGNNAIQAAYSINPPMTNNTKSVLVSQFLRADLSVSGKYLFSGSVRRDGSSRFGDGNKYAVFPSVSGAWRISNEEFLKDVSFIDNLKLRASWGQSGNQAINPYTSLTIAGIVSTPQGSGTSLLPALAPNLPSPDITWETTTQTNIGIDFSVLQGKYRLGFDYYNKITDDLISFVSLSPSSGFSQLLDNVGKIKNSGIELVLGATTNITSDIEFDFDFNISRNTNEVLRTSDGEDILLESKGGVALIREGESLSSFYLVKFLGFDSNGDPLYEDINDNGVPDGEDRQIVGNSLPDFIYGLNIQGRYKQLSLVMNWQGSYGGSIFNNLVASALAVPDVESNKIRNIYDYFPNPSTQTRDLMTSASDQFLEDGSYLRLKNIKVNYQFSFSEGPINALDLYVSGQNLLTFTKYTGYDPEVNTFGGNDLRQGFDYGAYPSTKMVTLGMNVTF